MPRPARRVCVGGVVERTARARVVGLTRRARTRRLSTLSRLDYVTPPGAERLGSHARRTWCARRGGGGRQGAERSGIARRGANGVRRRSTRNGGDDRVGGRMSGFRLASPDDVRRLMATAILGQRSNVGRNMLGRIELRPHQVDAAERLVAMIDRHGGAMLAEPVGLGKTYTAIAVANRLDARRVMVAVPASLREMWSAALRDCCLDAILITHEALSRGPIPSDDSNLVIVDESHRLRNPATKRYASVAALCARSRVLLVSATPVQNSRADVV